MPDRHLRVVRVLGYCLTLATVDGWCDFAFVAAVKLTAWERRQLAVAALLAIPPDDRAAILEAVAGAMKARGGPQAALLEDMAEARNWASWADRRELKAYALAAFEAMTPQDQAAFFRYISTLQVAA